MDVPLEAYTNRWLVWAWIGANLLPMWLITLVLASGGNTPPHVPESMAVPVFAVSWLFVGGLIWRGWLAPELLLFDLAPLLLVFVFADEMPSGYASAFQLASAVIMTVGGLIYGLAREHVWRWMVVAVTLVLVFAACSNASAGVWAAFDSASYQACFPGCVPDTFPGQPWWKFFFALNG